MIYNETILTDKPKSDIKVKRSQAMSLPMRLICCADYN